jgi:uncharacterized protein (TIGR03083 family)
MAEKTIIGIGPAAALGHREAMILAATEFDRMGAQLTALTPADWARPTACELWDVRGMAAHVLGMAEAQASFRQFAHDFRAAGKRTSGKMIDEMSATQVRERAAMTPASIVSRLAAVAPKAVRARRRTPALARWAVRLKNDPPFDGTPRAGRARLLLDRRRSPVRCRADGHEGPVLTSADHLRRSQVPWCKPQSLTRHQPGQKR